MLPNRFIIIAGLAKTAKDWKPKETCSWCNGSRVGVSGEKINISYDIDPAPEPPKKTILKKKVDSTCFNFDKIPKPPSIDSTNPSINLNNFGALFNPFLAMPNGMFPPWPLQQPFNNHSLPFDRMYSHLQQQQQHPRPQFDVEALQRMSEWQNQMFNMNMMQYFLRAPHLLQQFPSSSSTAQQQLFHLHNQQQQQHLQQSQIRPFILKDPPKKANKAVKSAKIQNSCENDEIPLDLSVKKSSIGIKKDEDDRGAVASVDLNDKSSSPELNETGNKLTKRNYTQQALNEAVSEILSGRLGTRRASVVYGIPRSTLRNKIYKLESIDETNGEMKRKKAKKVEEILSETKAAPKLEKIKEETDTTSHLQKSQSMPTIESPSTLSFGTTSMLPQPLPLGSSLTPFTDLFKQYVDKQIENGNSKETSVSPQTENSSDEMEKQRPRQKRGQYRKYDKGALEKAVLSVRKGEMSVHRAGSFYGVPHSTLEYKVKERNLLRSKRRFNNGEKKSISESTEQQHILQKTLSSDNVDSSASSTSEKSEMALNLFS
uniref:HTH psq-type domain-containing protein n=1 Tax=Panagrolaimus sp. PS1159 TaxID=55785 RepID=A0AC35GCH3_9BILA